VRDLKQLNDVMLSSEDYVFDELRVKAYIAEHLSAQMYLRDPDFSFKVIQKINKKFTLSFS
jgi:hypothetical protein